MKAIDIALRSSIIAPVSSILIIAAKDLFEGRDASGHLISYSTVAVAAVIFLFLSSLYIALLILDYNEKYKERINSDKARI